MTTNDDTIFEAEGTLPDGRLYHAELWQLGAAYHMTIFMARNDGETAGEAATTIEAALLRFCGAKYRRIEPVFRQGEPTWSYNVVVCDDQEQFVSRMPLWAGVDSFSVWYGEREVRIGPSS